MTAPKWYPSPEFLAQAGHVLLGIVAVIWPAALWGGWIAPAVGTGAVVAYMLIKEFTFDIWIEGDDKATGWKDFIYLMIGSFAAWASLVGFGRVG